MAPARKQSERETQAVAHSEVCATRRRRARFGACSPAWAGAVALGNGSHDTTTAMDNIVRARCCCDPDKPTSAIIALLACITSPRKWHKAMVSRGKWHAGFTKTAFGMEEDCPVRRDPWPMSGPTRHQQDVALQPRRYGGWASSWQTKRPRRSHQRSLFRAVGRAAKQRTRKKQFGGSGS